MAENFSTVVNATDEATVIHVRGEIDIATAGRLRDVIEPHMGPKQTIILDLSEVEFMDSSSLHVLIQARGRLKESRRLTSPPQPVARRAPGAYRRRRHRSPRN
jgi:anti-anti-sigma factor